MARLHEAFVRDLEMSPPPITVSETDWTDSDDHSGYGKPLKWIGLYVAAATLVCFFCMAADLFRSFKRRKLWVVPKQFRFNAATLTLLGVATKIASDITESMPGRLEQPVKQQSVNLISYAMVHAMPSFTEMSNMGLISNMVALGILVISTYVDVWFQVSTSLIDDRYGMLLSSSIMLFIFLIAISHSLTIPVAKSALEKQYNSKHVGIMRLISSSDHVLMRVPVNQLEHCIYRFWLMALTSSPDYALLSSEMSYLSALLCWLGIIGNLTPVLSALLLFSHPRGMVRTTTQGGETKYIESIRPLWYSHYSWSMVVIFYAQFAALVVGTITCLLKIWNSKYDSRSWNWRSLLKMQRYHTQKLKEWQEAALPFHVTSRRVMMIEQLIKDFTVVSLLSFQYVMIFLCKLLLLPSTYCVSLTITIVLLVMTRLIHDKSKTILLLVSSFIIAISPVLLSGMLRNVGRICSAVNKIFPFAWKPMGQRPDASRTEHMPGDLNDYVLQMEGEVERAEDITQRWKNYPRRWILSGRSNCLVDLRQLVVDFASPLEGFPGARLLFNDSNHLVDSEHQLPTSWSLPVVTLASLIYATRGNNNLDVSLLVRVVGKCIKPLKLVDGSLDLKSRARLQEAADLVWQGLHLHGRWLDTKFGKGYHAQIITSIEMIRHLNTIAKCKVLHFVNKDKVECPPVNKDQVEWPPKILAASCMYRITHAILEAHVATSERNISDAIFFKERLRSVLADVLGACFSNLPLALFNHCSGGKFGAREDRVQEAAIIFGEMEKLLKHIEDNGDVEKYPQDPRFLDNWCKTAADVV